MTFMAAGGSKGLSNKTIRETFKQQKVSSSVGLHEDASLEPPDKRKENK